MNLNIYLNRYIVRPSRCVRPYAVVVVVVLCLSVQPVVVVVLLLSVRPVVSVPSPPSSFSICRSVIVRPLSSFVISPSVPPFVRRHPFRQRRVAYKIKKQTKHYHTQLVIYIEM